MHGDSRGKILGRRLENGRNLRLTTEKKNNLGHVGGDSKLQRCQEQEEEEQTKVRVAATLLNMLSSKGKLLDE